MKDYNLYPAFTKEAHRPAEEHKKVGGKWVPTPGEGGPAATRAWSPKARAVAKGARALGYGQVGRATGTSKPGAYATHAGDYRLQIRRDGSWEHWPTGPGGLKRLMKGRGIDSLDRHLAKVHGPAGAPSP